MQAAIAYLCCRQYECPLKAGVIEIQHDEDTHVRFSLWLLTPEGISSADTNQRSCFS